MDVFEVHRQLISDYSAFTTGFAEIRDRRIAEHVAARLAQGDQWPDPYLSLNPNFASGGSVPNLVAQGLLHPECERIFRVGKDAAGAPGQPVDLHQHQREAVEVARGGAGYVLTTGTGSGKSLAYLVPIVDWVLRQRDSGGYVPGVKAIIVYPMNALANSQCNELTKFLTYGYPDGPPVTFRRYTGQDREAERAEILADPPDILLTNYVMAELVLTRPGERERLVTAARGLRFLVLDELHTYRGRQGADVGMLVRRLRQACGADYLQCVGTSATMTTEGSEADRRRSVADVASRLFGAPITPANVIGETLRKATTGDAADRAGIAARIDAGQPGWDHAGFVADPLVAWVEETFGLARAAGSDRLSRPARPRTIPEAAAMLAGFTDRPVEACREAIQATLQAGAELTDPRTRRPVFAFRLHQFLSKGDNVYSSIESEDRRYITSRYQTVAPEPAGGERVLLPATFCRECGQEYLVVRRADGRFTARLDRGANDEDGQAGYLFVSTEMAWPDTAEAAIAEQRLPASWLAATDGGGQAVVASRRGRLPEVVHVDTDGVIVAPGEGTRAAFLPTPFAFCLACRVSYEQLRGNDFGRLASLATEGRSSAMSVVSASVVRSLRAQDDLPPGARKLLAFADNRQDASLQAGHFNDFIGVTQLRGALYRAVCAEPGGLTHEVIEQRVTDALGLRVGDFAQNPDARFSAERRAWQALRAVVGYRLYLDLERGWRITMPNLEQTGLVRIDYLDLPEIAAAQEEWADQHAALRDDVPEHRAELMRILLDELRRVLAVDAEQFGDLGFEQLTKLSRAHLAEPWALSEREARPHLGIAFPHAGGKGATRGHLYLSAYGGFGRYLLRDGQFPHAAGRLSRGDAGQIIADLLKVAHKNGMLTTVTAADGMVGYQLKTSAICWRAGDGRAGVEDPLRRQVVSEHGPRVNPFFRRMYADVAESLAGLQAREHTAQVSAGDRMAREEEFRAGTLPVLYCSPTLELGVDIADLNAVGMRNVPPTPANYAQRAGRAGRSGQPALVVTYCSTGNAHDQYHFRHRDHVVAGSVTPPRLDLSNEDLLRSHVHAIWLAETGLALDSSLANVVDLSEPDYPLAARVRGRIGLADARDKAAARARSVLAGLPDDLTGTPWWHDEWVDRVVADAPACFDAALDRWRELYRAADAEQRRQNEIVLGHSSNQKTRDIAAARRREAENQLRLLRNQETEDSQSDFYSYRYLASEGFLPGYSFPRLPLRAYVPGRPGVARDAEFIHRPRFIAISEFGPGALIYHEGLRYLVNEVQLDPADRDGELATGAARRCAACGYLHDQTVGVDLCQVCGGRLGATMHRLLRLQTVRAARRDRISSDEEERRRAGFDLVTSYRFATHGSRPASAEATAGTPDADVLHLHYGDTATVWVTNLGLRRRRSGTPDGYWIDPRTGRWLSESRAADLAASADGDDLDDVASARAPQRVIPYVEDRRNILVTRLAGGPVDEATACSLMYALERGIEAEFQLEDSELTSELLPDDAGLGRALFVESAEGGAGVLRRLVEEPDALARAARQALEIAHFDQVTGADDGGRVEGSAERCARACYDCLLSYSNQGAHLLIDRHRARDLLLALAGAATHRADQPDRVAIWQDLTGAVEQDPPRRAFLAWLAEQEYRAPDDVAPDLPGTDAAPDLVYRLADGGVAVFVDGPGDADSPGRDEHAADDLRDAGWNVIRVAHGADYRDVVSRYPSVFGIGRNGR